MQKKSMSRSAFFNLRLLVCFNVSLIGVLLALFAGAKPSNPGPVISVTPGSLSVTVRSQCKL
jgi:hypothetical protein